MFLKPDILNGTQVSSEWSGLTVRREQSLSYEAIRNAYELPKKIAALKPVERMYYEAYQEAMHNGVTIAKVGEPDVVPTPLVTTGSPTFMRYDLPPEPTYLQARDPGIDVSPQARASKVASEVNDPEEDNKKPAVIVRAARRLVQAVSPRPRAVHADMGHVSDDAAETMQTIGLPGDERAQHVA